MGLHQNWVCEPPKKEITISHGDYQIYGGYDCKQAEDAGVVCPLLRVNMCTSFDFVSRLRF